MLNNKKVNIIISLIIAACLWAYVIGETNPIDTKTIKSIPINFINEDVLEENGLAILEISDKTVDIKLKGTRAQLSKIGPQDVVAVVNLGDAAIGHNVLKINIKIPENVEIEDKSINKVSIDVEKKELKTVDIEVSFEGTFSDGKEPSVVELEDKIVVVSGAESRVKQVAKAAAIISANEVKDDMQTLSVPLVAVDKNGQKVEGVELSSSFVKVTAKISNIKTVPLKVEIQDSDDEEYVRTTVAPKTITIKGKAKDLDKINSLEAEPIDISGITEDTSLPIKVLLPEGVHISEQSVDMKLKVTVKELVEKELLIDSSKIIITGVDIGNQATPDDMGILVYIKGTAENLEKITEENIVLSVDLTNHSEVGNVIGTIEVSCDKPHVKLSVKPEKININIAER